MKCTDSDYGGYIGVDDGDNDDNDNDKGNDVSNIFLLLQVPTIQEWLQSELHPGDVISADPRIISYTEWTNWDSYFSKMFIISFYYPWEAMGF
jgi:hypothetical protein